MSECEPELPLTLRQPGHCHGSGHVWLQELGGQAMTMWAIRTRTRLRGVLSPDHTCPQAWRERERGKTGEQGQTLGIPGERTIEFKEANTC